MKPLDRIAARDLVLRVAGGGKTWDAALETVPSFTRLSGRDRGFAYRLAAATLRHHNLLNGVIKTLTGRAKISPPMVGATLACGLCEILFLDAPAHAAVNSAVNATPQPQRGLVNAVLRRAAKEKDELLASLDIEAQAAPAWLWADWVRDWGEADARAMVRFCLEEPALDITLKDSSESEFYRETLNAVSHEGGLCLPESGNVASLPGFEEGAWWVQDAAAALPVKALGDLHGKEALDLCAAPGGKTLQLAASGARVVAVDNDEQRLERVYDNLYRCDLTESVEILCADGTTLPYRDRFDVVVLDAPCSATGTLRRHPDMWARAQARDIETYIAIQRALFDKAVSYVKPGGVLVYITCSLDRREGEAQTAWARESYKNLSDCKPSDTESENRIFPFKSQTDGFFFAYFKRES